MDQGDRDGDVEETCAFSPRVTQTCCSSSDADDLRESLNAGQFDANPTAEMQTIPYEDEVKILPPRSTQPNG